ncbi:hypothetical protein SERLA73DRAFT_164766 [Serpula lacrymans var. lacrymans S7.3]|uniref:Glycosyltransferase family 32 protein n=2 Tax=Serpula lacrymans var. lacrymans TaxID=341189 RepID=F8PIH1_SERL3|nr:uncharacterized protein SERLADRAFT_412461 [Serpula lacrymans var. lacrymans S7.9]EGO05214.1 hypothetical protein SERLA73DRAFT_164766 [Serpula lacrymans var. lacrymans S7.3]EGO30953.1 hypothetical protein SERLADRAFT_412461 [Serpula lacrymans var. lacrymans S7.9]
MASSDYFPMPQRGNGYAEKGRSTNGLPTYSSAVQEKMHRHSRSMAWVIPVSVPIPGVRTRRLRLYMLNPSRMHQFTLPRIGRKRGPLLLMALLLTAIVSIFVFARRFGTEEKQWTSNFGESSTLVFGRDDLQQIWKWEIESGHYPSNSKIPEQVGLNSALLNPALPPRKAPTIPSRFRPPPGPVITTTRGDGPRRVYLDVQSQPPNVAYPPRPVPGSVADLDVIMEHCDFSENKYVRDCLEVLRLGGGLDNGDRLRRGKMDDWKYIYMEEDRENFTEPAQISLGNVIAPRPISSSDQDPNAGLVKKRGAEWETPLSLRPTLQHTPYSSLPAPCDPENPRLFHMFWTGPFTDKPYLALLSFLFTQNAGLHVKDDEGAFLCRPEFWMWINPGPAATVPNPSALGDMFDQLKTNPWAAPFLHPRFKDVIKFKLWNTTEQLDGVPELKDEWRTLKETLFNSGGHIINVPPEKQQSKSVVEPTVTTEASLNTGNATGESKASSTNTDKSDEDDMLNRTGSKSSSSYDRLSVILSDMARFVLCHRFGGIYLDADTIFLRDWEELWGWKGAFAYRWSRLEKYNTAVLRMNKNSALGSFLFRTALKNGLDFHPMTVSRYTKDAYLEGLLLRLPDALFDSAWLNTEYYQRDRPPQPYFIEFADFFDTPAQNSAAPQALGFEGFFRGAYSYHFHNFWWKPFDASRNWPDLGPKFMAGERAARAAATPDIDPEDWADKVSDDKRDLDWATVLKRTFEAYIRGDRPNMYGEWIQW